MGKITLFSNTFGSKVICGIHLMLKKYFDFSFLDQIGKTDSYISCLQILGKNKYFTHSLSKTEQSLLAFWYKFALEISNAFMNHTFLQYSQAQNILLYYSPLFSFYVLLTLNKSLSMVNLSYKEQLTDTHRRHISWSSMKVALNSEETGTSCSPMASEMRISHFKRLWPS